MLGAIIGDVAGSTYEVFECDSIKNKKDTYFNRIRITDSVVPLFSKESSYTDDSILTSAIAKSLLEDKNYKKNLKEFGLKELSLGVDKYGRSRFGKGFCDWVNGNSIGNSYGNGCAMRISSIAMYFDDLDTILEETKKATYPSHDHIESYIAAGAVSTTIYLAKNNYPKNKIKKIIELNFGYDLDFNLEELQKNYKFTSKAKNSVPQAIYCFLISKNFEDAIRKAISIGGDSDTIAAITGSIAEAYYGIDYKLVQKLENYLPEYIINIVNDFYISIGQVKPFKNKLKDFFREQNLYSEDFFDFVKGKEKILPIKNELAWFGCFPVVEKGILKDIKIMVPEIVDEQTMLINIHEYTHALALFNELGMEYIPNIEKREVRASNMEKIYKKRKSI